MEHPAHFIIGSEVDGHFIVTVPEIRIGTLFEEEWYAPCLRKLAGIVEGGPARKVLMVDVGPILEQHSQGVDLFLGGVVHCVKERGLASGIYFVYHVGLPQHHFQHFGLASRSGIVGHCTVPKYTSPYLLSLRATFAPFFSSSCPTNSLLQ